MIAENDLGFPALGSNDGNQDSAQKDLRHDYSENQEMPINSQARGNWLRKGREDCE
jgi:hypothetical protein